MTLQTNHESVKKQNLKKEIKERHVTNDEIKVVKYGCQWWLIQDLLTYKCIFKTSLYYCFRRKEWLGIIPFDWVVVWSQESVPN